MIDRDQLQGPLGVSLAASILLFVVGCWLLLPALGSLRVVGGGDNLDDAAYDRLVAAHDVAHRTDLNRIHGRSFFFEPPAPPRPIAAPRGGGGGANEGGERRHSNLSFPQRQSAAVHVCPQSVRARALGLG